MIVIYFCLISFTNANLYLTSEIDFSSYNDDVMKLVGNILNRTEPASVGFIVDSIFIQHFNIDLMTNLRKQQMFFLTIKDSESFENRPSKHIRKMLSTMREENCELYIILITNGVQMSGFLQYADYNRLLNVKSNVLILYDHRLFVEEILYIWKRIINVIFIRKDERRIGNWFELSTVPFPQKIINNFVPKIINSWTPPNIFQKRKLIWPMKNEKNVNGVELNVVVFRHTPTAYENPLNKEREITSNYTGLEIDIINALSQKMNFTINFYEPNDVEMEKLGRKLDEGNYTGLLGEIDMAKADIALGDLHYTMFNLDIMDLTVPYNTECLTFLTPEILSDDSWKTLIAPFSLGMWIGVLISLVFVGIFFYGFSKSYKFFHRNDSDKNRKYFSRDIFDEISTCLIYTYSMILVVSLPRLPNRWATRVLTGWWWIYSLLVVVVYRASLTSILANPQPKLTIDTIEELSSKSWLQIGAWGEQNREFFSNSTDKFSQIIGQKIQDVRQFEDAIKSVADGKMAIYENYWTLQKLRFEYEKHNTNNKLNLHIMNECAIQMPISIGLEKNSPFKEHMDKLIRYAIEGGLIVKWLKDAVKSFESSIEPSEPEAVMNLKKFYGALFVLLIGYSLSILTFLIEVYYWKCFTEKHPNYDRYRRMIVVNTKSPDKKIMNNNI